MKSTAKAQPPLIEITGVSATTHEGRLLFKELDMSLSRERVALIGRNGVGKSTLLDILSGQTEPGDGRVALRAKPYFIPQSISQRPSNEEIAATLRRLQETSWPAKSLKAEFAAAGLRPPKHLSQEKTLSHGEFRKLKLLVGKLVCPDLLLLDEPTQDLDELGVSWLRSWLADWQGALLVASHDSRLLQDFEHFFIVAETGCRLFSGTFAVLEAELEKEHLESQKRYVRNLNRLVEREEHMIHIARRRARKRQYGRVSELGRATPRMRLNQKRDYAQVKHGKMKRKREVLLNTIRDWTKATRRALRVDLPLVLPVPELPAPGEHDLLRLEGVSAVIEGRCLFKGIDIRQRRERLAVIGPNGTGKTTLLEIMLGRRNPTTGSATRDNSLIGAIAQGGSDWLVEESLASHLSLRCSVVSVEAISEVLVAHKFPLALAQRPLRSLSPGERVRAALICLFQRTPAIELLVLDEPTYSLDLVGQGALANALRGWPGGLVVASHNHIFLSAIGINTYLELR